MNGPEAALASCRFVHDAATMMLWGASAYLAFLVPRDLGLDVSRRLDQLRLWAVALAVTTTAAGFPIECAAIGNGWADALDASTARAVLFETSVGRAWQAQAITALLLAATPVSPRAIRLPATAAASGLLLASLALTGHAAMHEGPLGFAQRLNDAVHVMAGGAWLGALVPLLPILRMLDSPAHHEAGVALRRFSAAGHWAVAIVIATGAANTLLILERWPLDWSSPYQALLATKIALVALMTALALVNRYILVRRMGRPGTQAARLLRRATVAEVGLGLAAIGCVGVFGLLEPV